MLSLYILSSSPPSCLLSFSCHRCFPFLFLLFSHFCYLTYLALPPFLSPVSSFIFIIILPTLPFSLLSRVFFSLLYFVSLFLSPSLSPVLIFDVGVALIRRLIFFLSFFPPRFAFHSFGRLYRVMFLVCLSLSVTQEGTKN